MDIEQITKETIHGIMLERMPTLVQMINHLIAKGYSYGEIKPLVWAASTHATPGIRNNMLLELDYLWESKKKSKELLFGKDD